MGNMRAFILENNDYLDEHLLRCEVGINKNWWERRNFPTS